MGRDEMRAGDSDRQGVAEQLRAALDEGRLELQEYDERLQRTYTAKTYGELNALLADLPSTIPVEQSRIVPVGGASAVAGGVTRRWLIETWDDYLGVVGVTMAIWAVTSVMSLEFLYFWPVWVAGPWGAYLLYETFRGLATGEPVRWVAEQERKAAEKEARKLAKRERKALRNGGTPS